MVEFWEEMIIDSFRIPWLIWIQVIVLLLLILLLYSFSLLGSPSDPSPADDSLCSPSAPSSLHGDHSHQKLQPQVHASIHPSKHPRMDASVHLIFLQL